MLVVVDLRIINIRHSLLWLRLMLLLVCIFRNTLKRALVQLRLRKRLLAYLMVVISVVVRLLLLLLLLFEQLLLFLLFSLPFFFLLLFLLC